MNKLLIMALMLVPVLSFAKAQSLTTEAFAYLNEDHVCTKFKKSIRPIADQVNALEGLDANIDIIGCALEEEDKIINKFALTYEVSGLDCQADTYTLVEMPEKANNKFIKTVDGLKTVYEEVPGKKAHKAYLAVRNCNSSK